MQRLWISAIRAVSAWWASCDLLASSEALGERCRFAIGSPLGPCRCERGSEFFLCHASLFYGAGERPFQPLNRFGPIGHCSRRFRLFPSEDLHWISSFFRDGQNGLFKIRDFIGQAGLNCLLALEYRSLGRNDLVDRDAPVSRNRLDENLIVLVHDLLQRLFGLVGNRKVRIEVVFPGARKDRFEFEAHLGVEFALLEGLGYHADRAGVGGPGQVDVVGGACQAVGARARAFVDYCIDRLQAARVVNIVGQVETPDTSPPGESNANRIDSI